MWGRQSYRWSDLDFEANLKDGIAVDWPIRYKDIKPWYEYVEKFVGISGTTENLPQLPDSIFMPPMEMNCVEKDVKGKIEAAFGGRKFIMGRVANITQDLPGRTKCQFRNLCSRGCPFGGYFSTQSSTLPAAVATGNLTLRPDSIVNSIIYDDKAGKATGVRVIDKNTKEHIEYFAKIIFVNGSTLGSTFVLMNSISQRFPNGFGNDSGVLGKYLMDHHFRTGASGTMEGYDDKYFYGRRANGIYIPVTATSAETSAIICVASATRAALRAADGAAASRKWAWVKISRKCSPNPANGAWASAALANVSLTKTTSLPSILP